MIVPAGVAMDDSNLEDRGLDPAMVIVYEISVIGLVGTAVPRGIAGRADGSGRGKGSHSLFEERFCRTIYPNQLAMKGVFSYHSTVSST